MKRDKNSPVFKHMKRGGAGPHNTHEERSEWKRRLNKDLEKDIDRQLKEPHG